MSPSVPPTAPAAPAPPPPGGSAPRPGSAAPPARRRGRETAGDMVRSLLVCLGLVAVVVLLFAHPKAAIHQPVDLGGATKDAVAAGLDVAAPVVPSTWKLTNARYAPDTTEGLPTWHVGYLTSSSVAASVDVTQGATPAWVVGVVGDDTEEHGHRAVGGTSWTVWDDGGSGAPHGLVLVQGEVTTVVSGSAPLSQLAVLAAGIQP